MTEKIFFDKFNIFSQETEGEIVSRLFCEELKSRTSLEISFSVASEANFIFAYRNMSKDQFAIEINDGIVSFIASGRRGFIFAIGYFLRKIVKNDNSFYLIKDISGFYSPEKIIRGHQLGYRTTPNSYDAWDYDQYRRYYLDLMYFGTNTVEHIPYEDGVSNRNRLMKYDEEEFLVEASKMADDFDLDVSLWHPNNDNETAEQAVERRKKLYARVPRLNVVFPPGGDPGELYPDELVERCTNISKVLKESHPYAQMWPSAQAPHSIKNFGELFLDEMNKLPDGIDGIVLGPNRAMELDELRRKLPSKYPIRFYPDITHCVRCDYPVHFDKQDWHFSLTSCLSRECTNPLPKEYRRIHKLVNPYIVGSVSYSEGINDDVNKAVWTDLDFDSYRNLEDTLQDYCRLFFFGSDYKEIARLISALEFNWIGDPIENPCIVNTFNSFLKVKNEFSQLSENWRFLQLYMRALCDYIIRYRRLFDLKLIDEAYRYVKLGDIIKAKSILQTDYEEEYYSLRKELDELAAKLFDLIGLQLNVEDYCANSWERGAILETIDNNVSDKNWLINRIEYNSDPAFIKNCFNRNKVESDEFYYSVAYDGLSDLGFEQTGEIYMNFRGDSPRDNNGTLPTQLFCIYDNFSFKCKVAGLTSENNYKLVVTFLDDKNEESDSLTIKADNNIIYKGKMFGGVSDPQYDLDMLAPKFVSVSYDIPKEFIINGCFDLTMSEDSMGVMFAEFKIVKTL